MKDKENNIWIGASRGLHKYNGESFELFSNRVGFRGVAIMREYEDRNGILWFSTFRGVNCYDPVKDSLYSPFDEDDELFGVRLSYIYQDENMEYWFASPKGLMHRGIGYSKKYTIEDGLPSNYVSLIIPDKKGNFWLATGKGISCFDGENFRNFSTKDGLNSDTPYLLIFDNDDNLWMGTNKGLDRLTIDFETGDITSISFYGKAEGFIGVETNSNAAFKDDNGDLWFGTVGGVTRYQKKFDLENKIEPVTLIARLRVQFKDQPMLENLVLGYDENHLMFDFTGISHTAPKKVRYKFRLKGLDEEWSPELAETFTTYSNSPDGEYIFQVLSCNNHKKWNVEPTEFHFVITPPFWKTWWFIIVSSLIISLVVFTYLRSRTIRFKREKEMLEQKVNERTKELNEQNEKLESAKLVIEKNRDDLEEKNRDITDSITYAQRIQQGMLPADDVIKDSFNDCFVLYRPKDIVSGDFYWLQEADGKTFFAAVDCTGHGVPGAMVSVLGYNALNRSIREFGRRTPASILEKLNDIVIETFSQSNDEVRDGMDISLCCIYQEGKSWKLEYAGANNPVWIYKHQSEEIEEIKADKQPIGVYDARVPFTNNKIDVESGDVIYLFSDGFADQFGGERGKKLKGRKFKEILREIGKQPMQQQHDRMNEEFDAWKANYEQVDDVCIIGIRI
ncbi:MAG: SpoIIE family protein phosphatase [Flavobacteriales bacterium]|nr:SpoIIE family protein phosphatase [Flavobacteriales bacterium]